MSFGASAIATSIGTLIAVQQLALAGAMLAAPIGVIALASGGLALGAARVLYRWEQKRATEELEELLRAIDSSLRSHSIFDEGPPPALPPSPRRPDSATSG